MIILFDEELVDSKNVLKHYGVKGMKWGVRKANMKNVRRKQNSRLKKLKSTMLANKRRGTNARKRVKIEFVENNNEHTLYDMHLNNVEMYNTHANLHNW